MFFSLKYRNEMMQMQRVQYGVKNTLYDCVCRLALLADLGGILPFRIPFLTCLNLPGTAQNGNME